MIVIPAIDLKAGRCVRLVEGREESAKVYDRDPLEAARGFLQSGAGLIHIVDLDGAFLGAASANQAIIARIVRETQAPVEVGGGVRSLDEIDHLINRVRARYVILGTVAVETPALVARAVARFGDAIVAGIDARGREVATHGWTEAAAIDAVELARRMAELGVGRIIYTDITRDGRLEGPNIETTREIARTSGVRVTASGGIASLDDIARLCELQADGVDSAVTGKALYEGRFTLDDAIMIAQKGVW
jgi:phosphoribosylformimino-5-aminoimidazole carboxamide ribotide isomerase